MSDTATSQLVQLDARIGVDVSDYKSLDDLITQAGFDLHLQYLCLSARHRISAGFAVHFRPGVKGALSNHLHHIRIMFNGFFTFLS